MTIIRAICEVNYISSLKTTERISKLTYHNGSLVVNKQIYYYSRYTWYT